MVSSDGAVLFSSELTPLPGGEAKCYSAPDPSIHNTLSLSPLSTPPHSTTTSTKLLLKVGQVLHHTQAIADKSKNYGYLANTRMHKGGKKKKKNLHAARLQL